jgi:hypothetical protein
VPQTATQKAPGPQEPFANFTTKTGICFPNRVLQRRRRKHLEKIRPLIRKLDPDAPMGMIEGMLLSFLESGKQERYFEEFYECFTTVAHERERKQFGVAGPYRIAKAGSLGDRRVRRSGAHFPGIGKATRLERERKQFGAEPRERDRTGLPKLRARR